MNSTPSNRLFAEEIASGMSSSECSPPGVIIGVTTISLFAPALAALSSASSRLGSQNSLNPIETSKPVVFCSSSANLLDDA